VGWGGVGWGGVKIISSNDIMCHAHSHPPSHNIRNIFDWARMRKQKITPAGSPQTLLFCNSGGGNWEKALGEGICDKSVEK
jgi:hypothetical protein